MGSGEGGRRWILAGGEGGVYHGFVYLIGWRLSEMKYDCLILMLILDARFRFEKVVTSLSFRVVTSLNFHNF